MLLGKIICDCHCIYALEKFSDSRCSRKTLQQLHQYYCNIWMKNSWKYLMHNHVDFLTFLSHLFDWQNCDSRRCKHSHLDANDSRWSYCLENLMRFSLGVIRTHHGHMPTSNSHISNLGKGSEKCCLPPPSQNPKSSWLENSFMSRFFGVVAPFSLAPKRDTQLQGLSNIMGCLK